MDSVAFYPYRVRTLPSTTANRCHKSSQQTQVLILVRDATSPCQQTRTFTFSTLWSGFLTSLWFFNHTALDLASGWHEIKSLDWAPLIIWRHVLTQGGVTPLLLQFVQKYAIDWKDKRIQSELMMIIFFIQYWNSEGRFRRVGVWNCTYDLNHNSDPMNHEHSVSYWSLSDWLLRVLLNIGQFDRAICW